MRARILLFSLVAGLAVPSGAQLFVVVPNDSANVEGPVNSTSPFSTFSAPSTRYQQVYDASQFPGQELLIRAIAFRPDVDTMLVEHDYDLEIWLSTTELAPDSLGSAFADNTGPDATLVFDGMVTLSTVATGVPKDFVVAIPLVTWFPYDPALGNLLLDVRVLSDLNLGSLDAVITADSVSRVATNTGSQTADSAIGVADTVGLVTRFTVVPEPVAVPMALAAIAALASLSPMGRRRGPGLLA